MLKLKQLFMIISFVFVLVITGCATDEINSVQVDDNTENELEEQADDSSEAENTIKDEQKSEKKTEIAEEAEGEKSSETDKKSADSKSEKQAKESKNNTDNKPDKAQISTKKTNDKNKTVTPTKEKKKTENSKQEKPKKDSSKTEKPKEDKPIIEKKDTVTISVSVPSGVSGPSYGPRDIEFDEGDSVFDILNKTGLDVNSSGRGAAIYVRGISGLKEFDEGPTSGWKYKVDGDFPGESAGSYEVKKGQRIEWVYTVDWTAD